MTSLTPIFFFSDVHSMGSYTFVVMYHTKNLVMECLGNGKRH